VPQHLDPDSSRMISIVHTSLLVEESMRIFSPLLLVVPALACSGPLAPGELTGSWSSNAVDVGSLMTLAQHGASVTGTGTSFNNTSQRTFQIQGTYLPPRLTLHFDFGGGMVCQYDASVQSAQTMTGSETCGGSQGMLNFSKR